MIAPARPPSSGRRDVASSPVQDRANGVWRHADEVRKSIRDEQGTGGIVRRVIARHPGVAVAAACAVGVALGWFVKRRL